MALGIIIISVVSVFWHSTINFCTTRFANATFIFDPLSEIDRSRPSITCATTSHLRSTKSKCLRFGPMTRRNKCASIFMLSCTAILGFCGSSTTVSVYSDGTDCYSELSATATGGTPACVSGYSNSSDTCTLRSTTALSIVSILTMRARNYFFARQS